MIPDRLTSAEPHFSIDFIHTFIESDMIKLGSIHPGAANQTFGNQTQYIEFVESNAVQLQWIFCEFDCRTNQMLYWTQSGELSLIEFGNQTEFLTQLISVANKLSNQEFSSWKFIYQQIIFLIVSLTTSDYQIQSNSIHRSSLMEFNWNSLQLAMPGNSGQIRYISTF